MGGGIFGEIARPEPWNTTTEESPIAVAGVNGVYRGAGGGLGQCDRAHPAIGGAILRMR